MLGGRKKEELEGNLNRLFRQLPALPGCLEDGRWEGFLSGRFPQELSFWQKPLLSNGMF